MNSNYKNILNLIKPEYRKEYGLKKENDKFSLIYNHVSKNKDKNGFDISTPHTIMSFLNPHDPLKLLINGKAPFVSNLSTSFIGNIIFEHLHISDDISNFILSIIKSNSSKYDLYSFFDNTFRSSGSLKSYKHSNSFDVKISEDFSNFKFISMKVIRDLNFRFVSPVIRDDYHSDNLKFMKQVNVYTAERKIFIDIFNKKILEENDDGEIISNLSIEEYLNKDFFDIKNIKDKAIAVLNTKINDIELFDWEYKK